MKVLLISYGIYEYDGRLNELMHVADMIGESHTVCMSTEKSSDTNHTYILLDRNNLLKPKTYIRFLMTCIRTAVKIREPYILFVDNFFAAIPARLIMMIKPPEKIIQDMREMYNIKEITSMFGKLCCLNESKLLKKSNVVLCANKYRAEIIKDKYQLEKKPLVYENIRFLYGAYDCEAMDLKYQNEFNGKINIISTGGISVARGTDKLVSAMASISSQYILYILGGGMEDDYNKINQIISKNKLTNVRLMQKVDLNELRYILSRCDIGVVHYHKNDDNNIYCASGKVYEYLAEGLPIVTTENIPLKEFCETTQVGIADDTFANGIMEIADNLFEYKKRVKLYVSTVSPEKNNLDISHQIKKIIFGD